MVSRKEEGLVLAHRLQPWLTQLLCSLVEAEHHGGRSVVEDAAHLMVARKQRGGDLGASQSSHDLVTSSEHSCAADQSPFSTCSPGEHFRSKVQQGCIS